MTKYRYWKFFLIIIGDDDWIDSRAIIMLRNTIITAFIIATGVGLTKNFTQYSIVGGNPMKLTKFRKDAPAD